MSVNKNVKVFWHLHDALEDGYEHYSVLHKIMTNFQYKILGKKAKLLSVSLKHKLFVEKLGMPKRNSFYVPNGIDLRRIKSVYKYEMSNKYLMFGWDYSRKGVDVAVKAFSMLYQKNIPVKLSIVAGENINEKIHLLNLANIDDAVEIIPAVEDVNSLYEKYGTFVHISRAEGLSYALLEAIYSGVNAIVSDIPENEFSKEFRGITFVKVGDAEDLCNKISEIKDTISLEDVEYNRRIIDEKYSLQAWSNKIKEFYYEK